MQISSHKQSNLTIIPHRNVLIIIVYEKSTIVDFNAQLGKIDGFKYSFHKLTNRNGNMLTDYLIENKLLCINTHLQKRQVQS